MCHKIHRKLHIHCLLHLHHYPLKICSDSRNYMYILDRFFELHFITIVFWMESLNLIVSVNNSNYEQLVVSFQGMVSPNHVAMAGLIASESTQEKLRMLENQTNGDTENGKNGVIKNRRWKKGNI